MKKRELVKSNGEQKVGIVAYCALAFAVVFFSGLFSKADGWMRVLDFQSFVGTYGKICEDAFGAGFVGSGGSGAKEAFMQALSIAPVMMFSMAFIGSVEYLGGLRAAQKLLTPVLRPLMGVPGVCGLAMILNWQSSDASAAAARELYESGKINANERDRLVAYEFVTAATVGVFFSNGAVLLPHIVCSTGLLLVVIMAMKILAGNLMRLYQFLFESRKVGKQSVKS